MDSGLKNANPNYGGLIGITLLIQPKRINNSFWPITHLVRNSYPTFKKGLGEDKLVPVHIGTSDTIAVSKSTAA